MGNVPAERVKGIFDKLDKDGNGYLKFEEVKIVANICGLDYGKIQAAYQKADKSKEGQINLVETQALLKDLNLTEEQLVALESQLAKVVLVLPNTTVLTMTGPQAGVAGDKKVLCRGEMQLADLYDGQMLLTIGEDFAYALNKDLPTVRIARVFYALPTTEHDKYYGIVIPNADEELLADFDELLDTYTTFKRFYSHDATDPKSPAQESPGVASSAPTAGTVSMFSKWSSKAKKAMEDVKNSDTYQKAKATAQKTLQDVQNSDSYKKAAEAANEKLKQVKESKTYKQAEKLAKDSAKIASEKAKVASKYAKEKAEEASAYAKQVIKSQEGKSVGDKVSTGLNVATDVAVKGIDITAKFAAGTVAQTAKLLKKSLKPAPKPKHVSEKTRGYVKTAAKWSGKAVVVSKHAASTALAVADALSSKLTEAIEGSAIYQDNKEKMQSQGVQDAKKVVKAGIQGSFRIMEAMIDAGLLFVAEVTVAAAEVAEHTQGAEVGQVAKDAGEIVTNAARAGANLRYVGLTPLAQRAVLGTTIEMLGTEEEKMQIREGKKANGTATLAVNLISAQYSDAK